MVQNCRQIQQPNRTDERPGIMWRQICVGDESVCLCLCLRLCLCLCVRLSACLSVWVWVKGGG
eukprot:COSAG03_NODE_15444_length_430_cov_1.595166_1_plen_62_part_10